MPASVMYFSISGQRLEKALHLLGARKSHDVFNARPVVPAPVENDDFAGGGKTLDVALDIHLRFFTIGRRRQRHKPKDARAHSLSYGFDRAALAGGVAAFEQNDDALPLRFHPILHVTKLDLELAQLLFVELSLHLAVVGVFDPRHVI